MEEMSDTEYKVTVRFVEDLKTGSCWFEEKTINDQWVDIPETKAMCEGNSRHNLVGWIERRRKQYLFVYRKFGEEETYTIN